MTDFNISKEQARQFAYEWFDLIISEIKVNTQRTENTQTQTE